VRLNIGNEDHAIIRVFDANDKLFYTNTRAGAETKIDLSSQPKGVYTVKVWWGDVLFVEEVGCSSEF